MVLQSFQHSHFLFSLVSLILLVYYLYVDLKREALKGSIFCKKKEKMLKSLTYWKRDINIGDHMQYITPLCKHLGPTTTYPLRIKDRGKKAPKQICQNEKSVIICALGHVFPTCMTS